MTMPVKLWPRKKVPQDIDAWLRPPQPAAPANRVSPPRFFVRYTDGVEAPRPATDRPVFQPGKRGAPVHPSNLPPPLNAKPFGQDPTRAAPAPNPASVVPTCLAGAHSAPLELELPSGTVRVPPLDEHELSELARLVSRELYELTREARASKENGFALPWASNPFTLELRDGSRLSFPSFSHSALAVFEQTLREERVAVRS
jgi:hypothetical protein